VTIDGFWIDDRIYWILWYSTWLHFAVHTNISVRTHVFTAVAWQLRPMADVRLPLSSRIIPVPQLPASKSNSSQRLSPNNSLTATANWSCLGHLGTDCVQNVSSFVAEFSRSRGDVLVCGAVTYQWLLHSCLFCRRCLARGLHATIFIYSYNSKQFNVWQLNVSLSVK
jgi:hypothetical protein